MKNEGVGKEIHAKLAGEMLEELEKAEHFADMIFKKVMNGERITEADSITVSCLVFGAKVHLLYHMGNKMFGQEDEAR